MRSCSVEGSRLKAFLIYQAEVLKEMSEFQGKIITCRAGVCWGVGEGLKVEEIEVAPPQKDEIRVKIVASGVVRKKNKLKKILYH